MKVPTPRKLPSGNWFVRLRLGGEDIGITASTAKECTRQAIAKKAEYLTSNKKSPKCQMTLRAAIDRYIQIRDKTISPSTLRAYRIIQKNRFQSVMDTRLGDIEPDEWQGIVNDEAALCAPKTLRNAWGLVRSVVEYATGSPPSKVTLPAAAPNQRPFLTPDEIRIFIPAVAKTQYAVPALLALSSLRLSEICALRWEDIPKGAKLIRVSGAVVPDENNNLVFKAANKTASSSRTIPVMIPELAEALERDRKPEGPILEMRQNSLRDGIARVCKRNGLPYLGMHGLRHSFASLAYHLQIPERIAAEIGGWSDPGTMHRIYTHIAQSDVKHYQTALQEWFEKRQ